MRRIAICGGIGSGKSVVSAILRELGAKVVVADEVNAALLLDPDYVKEIAHIFPAAVDNNGINKKELARIIYQSEADREKLMQVAHPRIYERMFALYSEEKVVFYEIPLMTHCPVSFDSIWFVKTDPDERIRRIIARDGVSEERARRVLLLQSEESAQEERADVVIKNDGYKDILRERVKSLYYSIIRQFS